MCSEVEKVGCILPSIGGRVVGVGVLVRRLPCVFVWKVGNVFGLYTLPYSRKKEMGVVDRIVDPIKISFLEVVNLRYKNVRNSEDPLTP